MSTPPGIPVIRFNAHGCRYVVGRNINGNVGLFANNGIEWIPFDKYDLDDVRSTLGVKPSEVLYVSIYRMPEPE